MAEPDSPQDRERERVERAAARAEAWIAASHDTPPSRLARVLRDESGREFAVALADRVVRPESLRVAANTLRTMTAPASLAWHARLALNVGSALAPVFPAPAVPMGRNVANDLFRELVIDERPQHAATAFAEIVAAGRTVIARPLTPRILGEVQAAKARERIAALLSRDNVDAVCVAPDVLIDSAAPWAFAEVAEEGAERLADLMNTGVAYDTAVYLAPAGVADLDLSVAMLTRAMELVGGSPRIGIMLDPGVNEAFFAMRELAAWARASGIVIEIALTWTDPSADRVNAAMHGWEPGRSEDLVELGANFVRSISWGLHPAQADAVRLSVPSSDPFLVAFAVECAADGEPDRLTVTSARGASDAYVSLLQDSGVRVAVAAPTAVKGAPEAAAWVARRLHALGDGGLFDLDPARFAEEADIALALRDVFFETAREAAGPPRRVPQQDRTTPADVGPEFTRVLRSPAADDAGLTEEVMGIARAAAATDTSPISRVEGMLFGGAALVETAVFQTREAQDRAVGAPGFRNTPDTDPASDVNRRWAAEVIASSLAVDTRPRPSLDPVAAVARGTAAASPWGSLPAIDRADALRIVGERLEQERGRLIQIVMSEASAVFGVADAAVSRAIDLVGLSAAAARELDAISGAIAMPPRVVVVDPSATDFSSIIAGVAPAVAVGAAVVIAAGKHTRRQAEAVAEVIAAAGLEPALVAVVAAESVEDLTELARAEGVDRVSVFGTLDRALAVQDACPDVLLQADLDGPTSMIITQSADIDTAVADLVRSAFDDSGQARGSTSVAILVGGTGRSDRFTAQLHDAVSSITVAHPEDPRTQLGPLVAPAAGDVLWALTTLGDGEEWFIEPQQRDERLWTPGVRVGVRPGSRMHQEWFAAPVLGVMYAANLSEAIRLQNAITGTLAAAIHTQDPLELSAWLATVNAPDLIVGAPTTGARAQRRPVGAWHGAAIGAPGKSGGPNRLVRLTGWRGVTGGSSSATLHLRGLDTRVQQLVEAAQPDLPFEGFDWVRRGALADAVAWDREFGRVKDVTHLGVERNLFRYRPVSVAVRASAGTDVAHLVRTLIAAIRSGAPITLSAEVGLPQAIRHAISEEAVTLFVESDAEWLERMQTADVQRARLIGPDTTHLRRDLTAKRPDVAVLDGPVTTAGRLELLSYLNEQSITIAAHRFGERDDWSSSII